jgi:hypothetical protein
MRRRLFVATALGAGLGAAAAVHLVGPIADAFAKPPREGFPPDPPPKANTKQWVFEIIVKQGVPSIGKLTPVTLKKAEGTPRVMGRYALEFYVGNEILDRLRFNVPLGGDGPREGDDQPGRKRPKFRANTKFFVRMAENTRATRLRFVDRATAETTVFFWPPDGAGKLKLAGGDAGPPADASAAPADAGASDAARDAGSSDAGAPRDAGKHQPTKP